MVTIRNVELLALLAGAATLAVLVAAVVYRALRGRRHDDESEQ